MIISSVVGHIKEALEGDHGNKTKIKGTVILMKKNALDLTDFNASILDRVHEFLGKGVTFQLVSSTRSDPKRLGRGKLGEPAELEEWITTLTSITAGESKFSVTFEWDASEGIPGAVVVKNNHAAEFFLKSLTIEDFAGRGRIFFDCNSWVYPTRCYKYDRVFFSNDIAGTFRERRYLVTSYGCI